MNEIIIRAINEIKLNVPKASTLSDDLLFGLVAYKYFFNDGKFDRTDFSNSYTDGPGDGGIDLVAVEESDLEKNLILLQSKNIQSLNSKDEVKDIFLKMSQTVKDFKNEHISNYNAKLRRIYREKYDEASDDENFSIKMALFLGLDISEEYYGQIKEFLDRVEDLQDFDLAIYGFSEVAQQIEHYEEGARFVAEGKIEIFKDDGIIRNSENGILINISALSLRELYDRYKEKGLFEQNFRYFIRNKKIDDQIIYSLKNKRDEFWFLNNGIIIGCKDFRVDGDNIKLEDFSIINGCQTTTIIGKYKGSGEDYDFRIPCKIVKPKLEGEDNFNRFISEIAEASNSQKPISDRDLKSNLPEQRILKRNLEGNDPKIYLEIKRGQGIFRMRNLENWQKVKNDQLGQLILSCLLQQPGTARSAKKKIFADKLIYNKVFKRTQDLNTLVDLLKLSDAYDSFALSENISETEINIVKNGKLAVLSITCCLIKKKRNLINLNLDCSSADWASDVTSDNLNGQLFNPNRPDDFVSILNSIFFQIIKSLKVLYESRGDLESSVTNFFKTDKKYHSIILDRISSEYFRDEYERERLFEKVNKVFV